MDKEFFLFREDIKYDLMGVLPIDTSLNCHCLVRDKMDNYHVCLNENQRSVIKTTGYKLPAHVQLDSQLVDEYLNFPLFGSLFLKIGYPDLVFYRLRSEPTILTELDHIKKMSSPGVTTLGTVKIVAVNS